MRELTYVGRWAVEWREAPDPTVQGDNEAIVAPIAATTCDVDSQILAGRGPIPAPFAIGHECIARIVDVGDAVTSVAPGDIVVVPWAISCGHCARCRSGLTAHCESVPHMAMFGAPISGNWGGLFSDLVKVPYAEAMLVPLPAALEPVAMASASDNWSLAWRLVAPHLKRRSGASVLVIARGSIGLYVCDIARALGAGDVLYVDPDEQHRALAERLRSPHCRRHRTDSPGLRHLRRGLRPRRPTRHRCAIPQARGDLRERRQPLRPRRIATVGNVFEQHDATTGSRQRPSAHARGTRTRSGGWCAP